MRLIVASHNSHKVEEMSSILRSRGLGVELTSLQELGDEEDIIEDGTTLEANALIKAREVLRRYHADCFSDDTGLEVRALGGAPGVYSARYAGEEHDAKKNMEKLLQEMEGVEDRRARFRTVIALICQGEEHLFEGIVEGEILLAPSGSEGFGYDPIFRPIGSDVSFAEMRPNEKNSISHRARALEALASFLEQRSLT